MLWGEALKTYHCATGDDLKYLGSEKHLEENIENYEYIVI